MNHSTFEEIFPASIHAHVSTCMPKIKNPNKIYQIFDGNMEQKMFIIVVE